MKVRLEFEVGAQELREFLGLPDVSHLQQEAVDTLVRKLRSGAAGGLDALAVLKSFVPAELFSLNEWQRLIGRALSSGEGLRVETETTVRPAKKARGAAARKKRGPRKGASQA